VSKEAPQARHYFSEAPACQRALFVPSRVHGSRTDLAPGLRSVACQLQAGIMVAVILSNTRLTSRLHALPTAYLPAPMSAVTGWCDGMLCVERGLSHLAQPTTLWHGFVPIQVVLDHVGTVGY